MKKLGTFYSFSFFLQSFVACALGKKDTQLGQKIKKLKLQSIIADILLNIAQVKKLTFSIVPRLKDPHEYEPLPEDVKKTSEADLIFYNTINLLKGGNAWFTKLVENAKKTEKTKTTSQSASVVMLTTLKVKMKKEKKTHAFVNLEKTVLFSKKIAKQLSAKKPNNKKNSKKNLKEYTDKC